MGGVTRSSAGASVPYVEVTPHLDGSWWVRSVAGGLRRDSDASGVDARYVWPSPDDVSAPGADFPPARVSLERAADLDSQLQPLVDALPRRSSVRGVPTERDPTPPRDARASPPEPPPPKRAPVAAECLETARQDDDETAAPLEDTERVPETEAPAAPPPDLAHRRIPSHLRANLDTQFQPSPDPASCRVPETEFPGSDIQDDAEDNLHRPAAEDAPTGALAGLPPRARRRRRRRRPSPARGERRDARVRRPRGRRMENPRAARRVDARRAPRARVVRPASTPLGDGGRTRRTNPRRRTHARAIRRLRGRRSVQSLRRRRRGDGGRGTFAVRGGAAAERFRAAGPPGRRRVSFQRAARGNRRGNRRVPRRRSRRRSSSRRLPQSRRGFTYPSPAAYTPARGTPRGSRVVRLLRASRGTRSDARAVAPRVRSHPRRRRRRHASNGEVREPRQPRTRARVGGSGVGSRGHHNHREGSSARGGSKPRVPARESPRGDDSRERFGKGRERREPRRRRERRRRRGKKRSRIFVRGGVGGSRAFARRDGAPRERRFRRIHDGKRRRGDGVGGCRSPRAPTLRGRFRRKNAADQNPRGFRSRRAHRENGRGAGWRVRHGETRETVVGTRARGALSGERTRARARAMLGESSEDAGTTTSATPGTATAAPTTRESRPPPPGVPGSSGATPRGFGAFAFVTGNGATVGVSAAALARARGLFDDAPPERRPAAAPAASRPRPSPAPASAANADADAGADADADAGGFKPPFAAHAPAASTGRTFHSPMLPGAARRAGPRDPPPRRFSGNAERPDSNPRPRLRRRPCTTCSRLAAGLANPCPCFSAVLSRTSAPRLLAGWTRSSAR